MSNAPIYTHTPEPPPVSNDLEQTVVLAIFAVVNANTGDDLNWLCAALEKRAIDGRKKYGTWLCMNNGRNPLVDYLQEQLDAIMYATQAWMESPSDERRSLIDLAIDSARLAHKLIEQEKS